MKISTYAKCPLDLDLDDYKLPLTRPSKYESHCTGDDWKSLGLKEKGLKEKTYATRLIVRC